MSDRGGAVEESLPLELLGLKKDWSFDRQQSTPARASTASIYSVASGEIDQPPLLTAARWRREGQKTCLVTLINVEGSGVRTVGAQMAVSESGQTVGYLTGGCLERELAVVAKASMRRGEVRQERYGRGSRFIDIRLPCGSGIDVLFDPGIPSQILEEAKRCLSARIAFELVTDVNVGRSVLSRIDPNGPMPTQSPVAGSRFSRLYLPSVRVNVFGDGYAPLQLACLLTGLGIGIRLHSDDEFTAASAAAMGIAIHPTAAFGSEYEDRWSAAVVLFHAHERDVPVLLSLLRGPSFYVGAVGGRLAASNRAEELQQSGLRPAELSRLAAPAGLVRGARSATELAVGIAAEILDTARRQRLIN